jgi:Protein kinase domain
MIVHRDINPQNILFNDAGTFVLAGFSLATLGRRKRGEWWEVRTYKYLAPEVLERQQEGSAADIWALGILCLDMLNLLPKVEVKEEADNFKLFRDFNWCGRVCALATRTGRLEMHGTVVKSHRNRISAKSLCNFLKSNPYPHTGGFRPSRNLLYALMREDPSYNHLNSDQLALYVNRCMEHGPPESAPSTSTSQQPVSPYQQPRSPYQQPTSSYQQPIFSNQQPRSPYQQPASPYQQPRSPYQQPISANQQPMSLYQQPTSPYQQLISPYQHPIFPYLQPTFQRQQLRSPYQQLISRYQQLIDFQSMVGWQLSDRSFVHESPDFLMRKLFILGADMERLRLDSRTGMRMMAGSEQIVAPTISMDRQSLATSAQAAAQPRSDMNRPRRRRGKWNEEETGAEQKEARTRATATDEKAKTISTGAKPGEMGTEVRVAPSTSTFGTDLRLGSSSEERPIGRGVASGQGIVRFSPLFRSPPTKGRGQSPHITGILNRPSGAAAQSRSPSLRQQESSSLLRVEHISPSQHRDRESPEPSTAFSRQVQAHMQQRQVKDAQPPVLPAPPPPSRESSRSSPWSLKTQPGSENSAEGK